MAPEVITGAPSGYAADWWAYGVVTFEMLCGFHPFYHEDREELCHRILDLKVELPGYTSMESRDFVTRLLQRDPERRLGSGPDGGRALQTHPFLQSINFDALFRKELEPPFRPEVQDDLDVSFFDDEFTNEPAQLTPPDNDGSSYMQRQSDDAFDGFSFTQESVMRQSVKSFS